MRRVEEACRVTRQVARGAPRLYLQVAQEAGKRTELLRRHPLTSGRSEQGIGRWLVT